MPTVEALYRPLWSKMRPIHVNYGVQTSAFREPAIRERSSQVCTGHTLATGAWPEEVVSAELPMESC